MLIKSIGAGIVIVGSLLLAGCAATPDLIETKAVVVSPPSSLLTCAMPKLPNKFASNKEVATLFVKTYHAGSKCENDVKAIKKFYYNAQSTVK